MNTLRIQGIVFSIIAGAIVVISTISPPFEGKNSLLILAFLIIVLGVPHGALDPVFAARLYKIRTPLNWMYFIVVYLLLAALVILVWLTAPLLFLGSFLLISLAHFSGDPPVGTAWFLRLLYGGAPIILPTLLHEGEVLQIFSFLIDPASAQILVSALALVSLPWLIAVILASLYELHRNALAVLEIAAVSTLAVVVPPLVSFTVFFCCMHSPRHLLRTMQHSQTYSWKRLGMMALGPIVGIGALFLSSLALVDEIALDAKLIQIIFIGLAALTVPHMVLVEQVRFYGWPKDAINN